jgi:putative transposase
MSNKQRHSGAEIAAKLEQAGVMSAQGKTQSEIARALGVSVMTYHRWRKAQPHHGQAASNGAAEIEQRPNQSRRISELQIENSRLRRLVTDLLLEKITLEEALSRTAKRAF